MAEIEGCQKGDCPSHSSSIDLVGRLVGNCQQQNAVPPKTMISAIQAIFTAKLEKTLVRFSYCLKSRINTVKSKEVLLLCLLQNSETNNL